MDKIIDLDFKKDFPSDYMDKEEDVPEKKMVSLTIEKYSIKTDFNPRVNKNEEYKVVYFKEKPNKAVKLNKTMAKELKTIFNTTNSKETIGKQVKLYWEYKGTQRRFHFMVTNGSIKTNNQEEVMDLNDIPFGK